MKIKAFLLCMMAGASFFAMMPALADDTNNDSSATMGSNSTMGSGAGMGSNTNMGSNAGMGSSNNTDNGSNGGEMGSSNQATPDVPSGDDDY